LVADKDGLAESGSACHVYAPFFTTKAPRTPRNTFVSEIACIREPAFSFDPRAVMAESQVSTQKSAFVVA
jgi:hypothetical protein